MYFRVSIFVSKILATTYMFVVENNLEVDLQKCGYGLEFRNAETGVPLRHADEIFHL